MKASHSKPIRRSLWFNKQVGESVGYAHPSEQVYKPIGLEEANLVGSLAEDGLHYPVIDIDYPCKLVKSTTPGHYHLYIDYGMSWGKYKTILMALFKAGVIQPLWYETALAKKCSFVRPPWVKKKNKPEIGLPQEPWLVVTPDNSGSNEMLNLMQKNAGLSTHDKPNGVLHYDGEWYWQGQSHSKWKDSTGLWWPAPVAILKYGYTLEGPSDDLPNCVLLPPKEKDVDATNQE